MWQAIIAHKEDDFYYLLKTFAESLENNLLKAEKPKERDSVAWLIELMNASNEELNSYMKRKLKPLNEEDKKLIEANKKLVQQLNAAQKTKEVNLEDTTKLTRELSNLNMKLRGKKGEEKSKLMDEIKTLRTELDEAQAKNKEAINLSTEDRNKKSKEIEDKIKVNNEKRKNINTQIAESKVSYKKNQRETALRNYMKSPTEENLSKFQSLFFSTRQLLDVKDAEQGDKQTIIREKDPLQFNKKQLDADLKALGWDGTGETAKTVLDNIKSRGQNNLQSKKFSILDLTENVTNTNYVRQLKSLVKENKKLLDSLTEANRVLSFEGDSREYFREVLDTKGTSMAQPKSIVKDKFDLIHSQHRGAIEKISQVLQNIYNSGDVSEKDSKLAFKLSRKLISAVKDLRKFKVYEPTIEWDGKYTKRTEIGETYKEKEISPEGLFSSTLEVYEEILNDLNLSQSQESAVAEEKDKKNRKVYEEVEEKLDSFISKLKSNKNLQMITVDIINAIMGISDEQLEKVFTRRAYDEDYNIYYNYEFSEEQKNKLMTQVMELKEELSNNYGGSSTKYYDKINEILEFSDFIDTRITRGKISSRKLSRILSSPNEKYIARTYLSKNLLPLLEQLNEEGMKGDESSKVIDNSSFERLKNYIENPKRKTFTVEETEDNMRYLERLIMSIPNTKLGKKVNRVFKNAQTQKYLAFLGLVSGAKGKSEIPKGDRSKLYDTENKLSTREEIILQVLKRTDKERYDRYIEFEPEQLKAQLQHINDMFKENAEKLSDNEEYNELDTDYERIKFIMERVIEQREKK